MLILWKKNVKAMKNNLTQCLVLKKVKSLKVQKVKKASAYYAADPYKREIVGNEYSSDFTIAGGKTPPAKYSTDYPNSDKSPIMGTNKIPVVKSSNGSSAPENRKDGPPGKNKK